MKDTQGRFENFFAKTLFKKTKTKEWCSVLIDYRFCLSTKQGLFDWPGVRLPILPMVPSCGSQVLKVCFWMLLLNCYCFLDTQQTIKETVQLSCCEKMLFSAQQHFLYRMHSQTYCPYLFRIKLSESPYFGW